MNERIEELLNEAEKSVAFLSNSNESKHKIAMQRFAELIVLECIEVIVRSEHATLNIDNFTDEKAQGIQLGLEFATIDIAEHFGIEE
jgi:ribonucleotide monophosphatase NagD (HAD superfamily)